LTYINQACIPGMTDWIEAMALNGSGIRDTARVFSIGKQMVMQRLSPSQEIRLLILLNACGVITI
jgi:transposase-like protein